MKELAPRCYQVEVVWNRESYFCDYGSPQVTLAEAIASAREVENSGDGARVKKTRVIDAATGRIVWAYGRKFYENKE